MMNGHIKKITAKFPGLRVLVVDDYIVNQEIAKEILELMECKVDVAADGEKALMLIEQNDYDIIFMDIQMPIIDGYTVTRQIRKKEEGSANHMVIVAVTANALAKDKEQCFQVGMDDYISKPARGTEFEDVLSKFFSVANQQESDIF